MATTDELLPLSPLLPQAAPATRYRPSSLAGDPTCLLRSAIWLPSPIGCAYRRFGCTTVVLVPLPSEIPWAEVVRSSPIVADQWWLSTISFKHHKHLWSIDLIGYMFDQSIECRSRQIPWLLVDRCSNQWHSLYPCGNHLVQEEGGHPKATECPTAFDQKRGKIREKGGCVWEPHWRTSTTMMPHFLSLCKLKVGRLPLCQPQSPSTNLRVLLHLGEGDWEVLYGQGREARILPSLK